MSHIVELMDRKAMTSITNVSRRAPAALVASLILGLTACGGSASASADGTYYTQEINNSGDLGQLVVEGGNLTHHEYTCDGVYEEPDVTSTGEFAEDYAPATDSRAADGLQAFEEACGAPFPRP